MTTPQANPITCPRCDVELKYVGTKQFQEGGYAVAIDTTVDDELRAEGTARDLIRLLNEQRKTAGLEIADRVEVEVHASGRVEAALHAHRDWIAHEILAVAFDVLALDAAPGDAVRVEIDGDEVAIVLRKIAR